VILEKPVLNLLSFESWHPGGWWVPWAGELRTLSASRGGKRAGAATTVEVGILTAELLSANGEHAQDNRLAPNIKIRIVSLHPELGKIPIFTGAIADLDTAHNFNKTTGEMRSVTTVTAADAVATLNNITRYGAVTPGGGGRETWAARIIRLAASATTPINLPQDDSPIVRYAI